MKLQSQVTKRFNAQYLRELAERSRPAMQLKPNNTLLTFVLAGFVTGIVIVLLIRL